MSHTLEALQVAIMWVAWPGMLVASGYALYRTVRFYREVQHGAFARLVLFMVIAWIAIMAGLGWVVTFFLKANPRTGAIIALPVLVLWGVSMATVVWIVQRWGQEAVSINMYYLELRSLDAVKTQLINTVAHELNTPLTPVKLKLDLLESGAIGELTPRQKATVESIQRSMTRVHGIIDQVVLAMQVQSGALRLKPGTDDVVATFAKAVQATAEAAARKDIDVQLHTHKGAHALHDELRLLRVFVALLRNAIQYSPEGSRVDASIEAENQHVRVEVVDRGVGMSAFELAKLFQPFRQSEGVNERAEGGAGLDLYIARGIVEAHGGTIAARSDGPGQGASFLVQLPRGQLVVRPPRPGAPQPLRAPLAEPGPSAPG